MRTVLLYILIFLMAACSTEKPGVAGKKASSVAGLPTKSEGSAGKIGSDCVLEIMPRNAVRESVFWAIPKDFSLADSQIEWSVNGLAVPGATSSQFSAPDLKRGDVVQATVKGPGFTAVSNALEIINCPPVISSMRIMPDEFKPGDVIFADATANDADDDPVTMSYEWTLNGQAVGTGQRLPVPIKRGDKISVKIIPFDGADYGQPAVSEKEIRNMPPMIEEHNVFSFDGTTYTYQVKATDPDGDTLTYSLESAPNGMTIDPSTGLVKWIVPAEFKGVQAVSVNVKDENGGTAKYNLKITLK